MSYKNSKVLITGGAGFIGVNLANSLKSDGAIVTVVDKNDANFNKLDKGIETYKVDVTKEDQLFAVPNKYDYVFHLAARTDIDGKKLEDYYENYEGTEKVLKWLDKKGLKKFVLYSTQLVVGIFNETRFINEDEPYRTKTAYGQSKIEAEKILKMYAKKNNIPYLIIRPTSVYGPNGKAPYRDFFLTIKNQRYFHIGKANNLISLCYVKNLVDLTKLLATNADSDGKIFYGNDFHPYTMRQFAESVSDYFKVRILTIPDIIAVPAAYMLGVLKMAGLPVPLYPFRLKNIKANYCYDISNSVNLGYVPKYDLIQGINETLEWYKQNDKSFK